MDRNFDQEHDNTRTGIFYTALVGSGVALLLHLFIYFSKLLLFYLLLLGTSQKIGGITFYFLQSESGDGEKQKQGLHFRNMRNGNE